MYYDEYLKGIPVIQLANKYNLTKPLVYYYFKKFGFKLRSNKINSRKYFFNEDYFETIDTSDKAYWLGFIYADGYITEKRKYASALLGISLSTKDEDHLIKFNNSINGNIEIKRYKTSSGYKKGSEYSRLICSSEKLANDLIKQGVLPHKSNIIKPPNISSKFYADFIRGYYDGDGSMWTSKNQTSIEFLGTRDMLNFIQDVLITNKVIYRRYPLCKRRQGQVVLNFKFGGNLQSFRFFNFIYYDKTCLSLTRKYKKYQEFLKHYNLCHPI